MGGCFSGRSFDEAAWALSEPFLLRVREGGFWIVWSAVSVFSKTSLSVLAFVGLITSNCEGVAGCVGWVGSISAIAVVAVGDVRLGAVLVGPKVSGSPCVVGAISLRSGEGPGVGDREGVGEGEREGGGGGGAKLGVGAEEGRLRVLAPSVCCWDEVSESDTDWILPFFQSVLANVCSQTQSAS